jgi:hypothetical protein
MNNMHYTADLAGSIQRGEKTQTRRIDKQLPSGVIEVTTQFDEQGRCFVFFDGKCFPIKHRLGEVLWVREPATVVGTYGDNGIDSFKAQYLSDGKVSNFIDAERFLKGDEYPEWITYCEGIPNGCVREMARTFIRITNIRVERLNEISKEDAVKEGIEHFKSGFKSYGKHFCENTICPPIESFSRLWESINGKNSFDNRWVPVYEFKQISKEEAINE